MQGRSRKGPPSRNVGIVSQSCHRHGAKHGGKVWVARRLQWRCAPKGGIQSGLAHGPTTLRVQASNTRQKSYEIVKFASPHLDTYPQPHLYPQHLLALINLEC